MGHDHFQGKSPLGHVAEKQAKRILSSEEIHGAEITSSTQAFADGMRDSAVLFLIIFALLMNYEMPAEEWTPWGLILGLGWILWKTGRAAYQGWTRLERLHRILAQEKWEIEHNRPQEREELRVLYGAKGFEGKLLEDVVDVLMADESRLLKVMIEEEMGYGLENIEHPLKQALGAFFGTLLTILAASLAVYFTQNLLVILPLLLSLVAAASWLLAQKSGNNPLSAVLWSLGLAVVSFSASYFCRGILLWLILFYLKNTLKEEKNFTPPLSLRKPAAGLRDYR
jgi:hypothetical protein